MRIKIKDIILSLIIGEAAGWLLLVVLKNLGEGIPQIKIIPFWIWPVFFPLFCLTWFLFAAILSQKIKSFFQIGKFVLVGGFNFLVDLGVLNLLIFISGIASGMLFSTFKAIAFTIAVINSYFWNKLWTFKNPTDNLAEKNAVKKTGKEFIQFVVVSLIGLAVNNLTASLIVNWLGPQGGINPTTWANLGALVASFIGMFWNFVGYKFIVFKK